MVHVDYILASTDILPLVRTFNVGDPNILSDHSVIEFSLITSFDFSNTANESEGNAQYISFTYKWDKDLISEYRERLRSEATITIFEQARTMLSTDSVTTENINISLNTIVDGIESCTKPLF